MNNPMLRTDMEYSLDGYTLKKSQNEIVDFMLRTFSCLNNSQAGQGKTLTSLTTAQHCINHSKTLQVIILCPKAAISAFKKELTNLIKKPYSIYTATEYEVKEDARYHIFSYSKLEFLEQWMIDNPNCPKLLIVDECHKLNNTSTKTYKVLAKLRPKFNIVYGLTATPLMNKLDELYYVINFIKPGFFGLKKEFESNYMIMKLETKYFYGRKIKKNVCIGTKNLDVLAKHLDRIMIGRKHVYNLDFQYRSISLNDEESREYMACARGLENEVGEEKALSARLHDLQRLVDGSHAEFSHPYLSSKEKLLVTTISEILQRNESTIIYTDYRETFDRIVSVLESSKAFLNFSKLHFINGSVKLSDRVKVENDMPPRSIVIVTRAGTASINLQASNNIICMNTPWSTGDTIQLIGRITRMDTKYDIQHVYFLEAIDTIDTYRMKVIQSKIGLITAIFGTQTTLTFPDDEPINLEDVKKYCLWKRGKRKF